MTQVITSIIIRTSSQKVWDSICNSKMPISPPWFLKLGLVPVPSQCEITNDNAHVGGHRHCETTQGSINQKITKYDPPMILSFSMVSDTMGITPHIKNMQDTFFLTETLGCTQLKRVTEFSTKGHFALVKSILLKILIKRFHNYTMKCFKILGET